MDTRARFLGKGLLGLFTLKGIGTAVPAAVAETAVAAPIATAPAIASAMTMLASGGLCTPLSPLYEVSGFSGHPIHTALPAFTAERDL